MDLAEIDLKVTILNKKDPKVTDPKETDLTEMVLKDINLDVIALTEMNLKTRRPSLDRHSTGCTSEHAISPPKRSDDSPKYFWKSFLQIAEPDNVL